jgi:predicted benzoate:H+ symporter BenE
MTTVSPLSAEPRRISQTRPSEYAIRFVFGGAVTAVVGVIATAFGPAVAGLFLAFPAILMASLTLIANHESRPAAGADALGAAAGSIGLMAFGAVVWLLSSHLSGVGLLSLATSLWLVVSLAVWTSLDAYRRRGRERWRPLT